MIMARMCFNKGWALVFLLALISSRPVRSDSNNMRAGMSVCNSDVDSYVPIHIVFVHGMGGGAWFWFEMITLFQQIGFNATAVDLTSHGINKAVADDVKTVAQYTKPLTDVLNNITGQVILVGHSLGGGSIAYASEQFPTKVAKAVYVSACMPTNKQSMFGAFPATTFPRLLNANDLILNFANGSATPTSASVNLSRLEKFYMSSTSERYVNLARVVMTNTPYAAGQEPLTLTPGKYGTIRRFYVRTGQDLGVLTSEQDIIIAANPPEQVFNISNGDHAVFFSFPSKLFHILLCISSL